MKKNQIAIFVLMIAMSIQAQVSTTIPLPEDVKMGKLDNGLTYYILQNDEPKDRVSFYFAQNVGAILEEDDEDGLAHFLEHMAFNGSKNFPKKALVNFLEENGLVFGRDFNAYTGHDETVYNIDNVPAKDDLIDKCLLILHDWSGSLSLKDKEIDNERGVIAEEWRQSRSGRRRIYKKVQPVLFNDSQYGKRDIIGNLDFINSFPYQSLHNYYKKWYRPDLQAVIVVGNIDVANIEQKIKTVFGAIKMPENAKKRPYYSVPDFKETQYILTKDPEVTVASIDWTFKQELSKVRDESSMRKDLVQTITASMLSDRLQEKTQDPNSTAHYMAMSYEPLALDKGSCSITIAAKDGKIREAFQEFYEELVRAQNFGFTTSEFERIKKIILNEYQAAVKQEKDKTNDGLAGELSMHFLQAQPVMKAKKSLEIVKKQLAGITQEEVSALLQQLKNTDNSIFSVTGPNDSSISYPTKEELLGFIANVNNLKIENYQDDTNNSPLISETLETKPVLKKYTIKGIEKAQGFILANGIDMVLYPSKESEDEISMEAVSFGGRSKVETDDLYSASQAISLVENSGLGDFTQTQLSKKRAGSRILLRPDMSEFTESIFGITTRKDLETLLQLTYLYFENPRFDKALFESQKSSIKEAIQKRYKQPRNVFMDSIRRAITNKNKRSLPLTLENLDKLTFEKARNIYKQRFADAGDFTFVISGNFDVEKVLPLFQKYLGNLKTDNTKEKWIDHNLKPKDGETLISFNQKMETPKTTVFYQLSGDILYSERNKILYNIITGTLDRRYTQTIREAEGGSYGVNVSGGLSRIPNDKFKINIEFDCNPDKAEKLLTIVPEEINVIAEKGPSALNLKKAKETLIKGRTEAVKIDYFWSEQILQYKLHGSNYLSLKEYKKLVETITEEDVKNFAKQLLNNSDVVEVVMNPEK
ncbi:M16 family metallopeptidase [Flavivirga eckloniae]|uniref:Peptidase M16 n=1 Tax=Flavivirga eckloniae TaxID=1803846 RepID=A0A2K9PLM2_9FLAO|nr:M16 family metallopeptidase [Flavivirga eckloniae]AUP77925.1 hypothetical protein C1H87_04035 [Flavivirga eckloniae]